MSTTHGLRTQLAATVTAGLVALAAEGVGMWRFFTHGLHYTNPLVLGPLFWVFGVGMVASAIGARRNKILYGRSGPEGTAVFVFAAISGVLASLEETTVGGVLFRLIVPLMAAWLFERAILAERRQAVGAGLGIRWKSPLERAAVALGLADAGDMSVDERVRARQLDRLARLGYRAHCGSRWLRRRRLARFRRRVLLPDVDRVALKLRLAAMYQAGTETSPEALAGLSPWAGPPEPIEIEPVEYPPLYSVPDPWTYSTPAGGLPVLPVATADQPEAAIAGPVAGPVAGGNSRAAIAAQADAAATRRRPVEETVRMYRQLLDQQPGKTQDQYAALLGIHPRTLRNAISKVTADAVGAGADAALG